MSLQMRVEFVETAPKTARDLARQARQILGLAVSYRAGSAISLDEAHAALTDRADWNAKYWDMEASVLLRLDLTVKALYRIAPSDIVVSAIWIGDKARAQRQVSPDELSEIIRSSRIETHTRYYVSKLSGDGLPSYADSRG